MLTGFQIRLSLVYRLILIYSLLSLLYTKTYCQSDIVGIIDFYGGSKISDIELRKVIKIKEGDSVSDLDQVEIVRNLKMVPGIRQAYMSIVCCEETKGQSVLYIGVSDTDAVSSPYHHPPTAEIRLPKEITDTYSKFEEVFVEGIIKGESGEDRSQGHSLMNYVPARNIQEKFVVYAAIYLPELKNTLRNSGDEAQRAIAAQVIAYAKDKNAVVDDLLYAVYDENDEVRNNATRALALIAAYGGNNPDLKIKKIPADPFIHMMNSIIWTDRNKGAAALLSLTEKKDTVLFSQIKKQASISIIDMAKWKNSGHAMMGYLLLGRITGFSDEEIYNAFGSEKKNSFLDTMIKKLTEN